MLMAKRFEGPPSSPKRPPRAEELTAVPRGTGPTKVEKNKWTLLDAPGIPYYLDKEVILIDEAYQRELSKKRSIRFASEWSWISFGAITVGELDGKFYVIDGQHRLVAARLRSDITELPCIVFKIADQREAASGFMRSNVERKAVSVFDRYHAGIMAGDETKIAIRKVVEAEGYHLSKMAGRHTLRCIAAFERIWTHDRATLMAIWPLIAAVHNGESIDHRILDGLFYLERNGSEKISSPYWSERVRQAGIAALQAAVTKAILINGKGGKRIAALGLLPELNKGIRRKHLEIARSA